MTDKTEKFLAKLDLRKRKVVLGVLDKLRAGHEQGIDIKSLTGHKDIF